jgi:hypothetical protein
MSGGLLSRLMLSAVFASFLVGACGSSSSAPTDYRGDPLCAGATVTEGTSCDLSVAMHGHTYLLTCDLSQRSCDCRRDGRTTGGGSQFGGSATPACTLAYLDFVWSDCCGTPD